MRPAGTRAAEAFAAARAHLDEYRAGDLRRPAIDLSPAPLTLEPPPRPAAPAPAVGAGVCAAVASQWHGTTDARSLVEASLAAAERVAHLAGVVHLDPAGALADARACDTARAAGRRLGPLHGIPITVKDVIDVGGMPTAAGSAAYAHAPERDAAAVARLRAAGAIILGKVATHEFALGVTTPQARNPHDPTRIPGGSSGGSAIAVATGIGLASLGTDTRASIRVPPALCGLVGFKPTYGRVPTEGVVTLSWTMDHVAPIALDIADAALLIEVLAPELAGLGAWARAGVEGMRIGVPAAAFAGAEPAVEASVRAAVGALTEAGAVTVPVDAPDLTDLERANSAGLVVSRAEAAVVHRELGLDRALYWEETSTQLAEAERLTAVDYITAQRMRADLGRRMLGVFARVDALLMPTAPVVAPPVAAFAEYLTVLSRNAIPWSLVGFPAASVPCVPTDGGLPVGLQLVAAPGRERTIVALGASLERAQARVPVLHAAPDG